MRKRREKKRLHETLLDTQLERMIGFQGQNSTLWHSQNSKYRIILHTLFYSTGMRTFAESEYTLLLLDGRNSMLKLIHVQLDISQYIFILLKWNA